MSRFHESTGLIKSGYYGGGQKSSLPPGRLDDIIPLIQDECWKTLSHEGLRS